ncbi:hypothetical protein Acy02nite_42370 [Actinoplanes cyaneus]|uniref:Uncharacterized protein n=1 Tax=Actinoplanes cyaneus TaxID=52696 RepID=A0A919IKP8_9ACTN|nr:hypothetical protein Acy02nite_42370 [Actinoplanes cyaneus]
MVPLRGSPDGGAGRARRGRENSRLTWPGAPAEPYRVVVTVTSRPTTRDDASCGVGHTPCCPLVPAYRKGWPNRPKGASITALRGLGSYDAFVVTDPAWLPGLQGTPELIDQLLTPADSPQPTDRKGRV